jgi:hypothetical protein
VNLRVTTYFVRPLPRHKRLWRWITRYKASGSVADPFWRFSQAVAAVPFHIRENERYVIEIDASFLVDEVSQ